MGGWEVKVFCGYIRLPWTPFNQGFNQYSFCYQRQLNLFTLGGSLIHLLETTQHTLENNFQGGYKQTVNLDTLISYCLPYRRSIPIFLSVHEICKELFHGYRLPRVSVQCIHITQFMPQTLIMSWRPKNTKGMTTGIHHRAWVLSENKEFCAEDRKLPPWKGKSKSFIFSTSFPYFFSSSFSKWIWHTITLIRYKRVESWGW